jgi:glycosyltransferase involved in cell wall biosynthesis
MNKSLLTVVIPSKNEEHYIAQTLAALETQTYITNTTPIYIADAGSTDATIEIIQSFTGALNIKLLQGGLPSVGRNRGAHYATTKYILFLDADITLGEKDSIEKAIKVAEERNLELVTTYIKTINGNWGDRIWWKLHGIASRTKLVGAFGAGMFILIRKQAFERLGGFDETIALGEDWDLTHRIDSRQFSVSNTFIYTTNRRFRNQGYWKTFSQYLMVALSPNYRKAGHVEYFDVHFN